MTHHQFGSITGVDDEATFELTGCILFQEISTVAVDSITAGERMPIIALELVGRINKDKDTVQTVWVMPVMDAGKIAGALYAAALRMTEEEVLDWRVGFAEGQAF